MGFSPVIVDSMSLWEFTACLEGWAASRGAEEAAEPPSWEEHLDMVRQVKEMKSSI